MKLKGDRIFGKYYLPAKSMGFTDATSGFSLTDYELNILGGIVVKEFFILIFFFLKNSILFIL